MTKAERSQVELRRKEKADAIIFRNTASQNMTICRHNTMNNYIFPDLTLNDHRFLAFYLAYIDPDDPDSFEVAVPAKEFTATFGLDNYSISTLDAELQKLKEKMNVKILPENSNHRVALFYTAHFEKDVIHNTWSLMLFGTKALPFYFHIAEGHFTKYKLSCVAAFNSRYQYILYNLIRPCAYTDTGEMSLTYELLRAYLCINPSDYPDWKSFKKTVLLKAQAMICDYSDIVFSFEKRKGTNLIIFIVRKKEAGYELTPVNGHKVIAKPDQKKIEGYAEPENKAVLAYYSQMLRVHKKLTLEEIRLMLEWKKQGYTDVQILSARDECCRRLGTTELAYMNGILKNRKKQGALISGKQTVADSRSAPVQGFPVFPSEAELNRRQLYQAKLLRDELAGSELGES